MSDNLHQSPGSKHHAPTPKAKKDSGHLSLRAELQNNLETQFMAKLTATRTLPDAVSKSLVALLSASGPTSSDIIEALSLEDPIEPEETHE